MGSSTKIPLQDKPLVFVDIETTGLDPHIHEIIEFAAVKEDSGKIFSTKIKPDHIETASEEALQVNGYRQGIAWEEAPNIQDIFPEIIDFLEGCIIAGQNVSFDMKFLDSTARRLNMQLNVDYHIIDVATLTYEHLYPCGITSLSLSAVCDFLGIEPEPSTHTALNGALKCREVYHKLLRASKLDRLKWSIKGLKWRRNQGVNP